MKTYTVEISDFQRKLLVAALKHARSDDLFVPVFLEHAELTFPCDATGISVLEEGDDLITETREHVSALHDMLNENLVHDDAEIHGLCW